MNHRTVISAVLLCLLWMPPSFAQGLVGMRWSCHGPSLAVEEQTEDELQKLSKGTTAYLLKLEELAEICRYLDKDKAVRFWSEAVEIRNRTWRATADLPGLAEAWSWLAVSYRDKEMCSEAVNAFNHAITLRNVCLKLEPRDPSKSWNDDFWDQRWKLEVDLEWLCDCYADFGKPHEALETYLELLRVMKTPDNVLYNVSEARAKLLALGLTVPNPPVVACVPYPRAPVIDAAVRQEKTGSFDTCVSAIRDLARMILDWDWAQINVDSNNKAR